LFKKLSSMCIKYFEFIVLLVYKLKLNDCVGVRHHLEARTDEVVSNRYIPLLKRWIIHSWSQGWLESIAKALFTDWSIRRNFSGKESVGKCSKTCGWNSLHYVAGVFSVWN